MSGSSARLMSGITETVSSPCSATRCFILPRLRSQVRLGRWPWLRRGSATAPYNVTIPAGGSVLIGEVSVGPGCEIRAGASYFAALSRIEYQIAAVVPLG